MNWDLFLKSKEFQMRGRIVLIQASILSVVWIAYGVMAWATDPLPNGQLCIPAKTSPPKGSKCELKGTICKDEKGWEVWTPQDVKKKYYCGKSDGTGKWVYDSVETGFCYDGEDVAETDNCVRTYKTNLTRNKYLAKCPPPNGINCGDCVITPQGSDIMIDVKQCKDK
jgi:hypothetical protein